MTEVLKLCLNPGCGKKFDINVNNEGDCFYHPGKPIFHDIKKGWTCCNQISYDWDEFQKIQGCLAGKHSIEKKDVNFFRSQDLLGQTTNEDQKPIALAKDVGEFEKEQVA